MTKSAAQGSVFLTCEKPLRGRVTTLRAEGF